MIIFESKMATFKLSFLEAAGAVVKTGSSLKPNHYKEIFLTQIRETLFMSYLSFFVWSLIRGNDRYSAAKIFLSLTHLLRHATSKHYLGARNPIFLRKHFKYWSSDFQLGFRWNQFSFSNLYVS